MSILQMRQRRYTRTRLKEASIAPLIKLDYFASVWEHPRVEGELSQFEKLYPSKPGASKTLDRDKDGTPLEELVKKHATWKTKSGADAKRYTIIDRRGLLIDIEKYIKSLDLEDVHFKVKNRKSARVTRVR